MFLKFISSLQHKISTKLNDLHELTQLKCRKINTVVSSANARICIGCGHSLLQW